VAAFLNLTLKPSPFAFTYEQYQKVLAYMSFLIAHLVGLILPFWADFPRGHIKLKSGLDSPSKCEN